MSGSEDAESLEAIWEGDLFDRRIEAVQLIAYIESVIGRPNIREDKKAFTIAVDAGYGEGKTFFLKRLARHIKLNHPVAFVDAWADDLQDEPLTALVATLSNALAPFVKNDDIQSKLDAFVRKSGQVAKIVSLGLLRRGIGYAINHEAVGALAGLGDNKWMAARVHDFEEGRSSIQDMKRSLELIVKSLDCVDSHPPIVIVIDELDRCRPNYAIKLLEEIKHLFDVPGIVFVLGMNREQLSYSVNCAYGEKFNGNDYFRRFIDREYRLVAPNLTPLVSKICRSYGVDDELMDIPNCVSIDDFSSSLNFYQKISQYLNVYGLNARDSFQLIDILSTCSALADGRRLDGVYLIPLIIGHILGLKKGALPNAYSLGRYVIRYNNTKMQREASFINIVQAASDYDIVAKQDRGQFLNTVNNEQYQFPLESILRVRDMNSSNIPIHDPSRYPDLVEAVGRFKVVTAG